MKRSLKLMPDYFSHPLWGLDRDNIGDIDPKTLPLSPETIQQLQNWQDCYDAILNWDDPASSGFASEKDKIDFERQGIELWQKLRQELAPNYEIQYFSTCLQRVLLHSDELKNSEFIAIAIL
ncbi:MAG: hypothetical protein AB4290_28340 [Spirulina sp.]